MPSPLATALLASAAAQEKFNDWAAPGAGTSPLMGADAMLEEGLMRPLEALCNDLVLVSQGGRFNAAALENTKKVLISTVLVKRLRIRRLVVENPSILEVPVPPIVLVAGLVRSGTTLLRSSLLQRLAWDES